MEIKIYKINAEIDLTKEPQEIKIVGTEDIWTDLGLWLETTAFLASKGMKYKEWNKEKMVEYIKDYMQKAIGEVV